MNTKRQKTKKWAGAGLLAAVAASLCCITPVLAVVAGISGIATTFSWLEPVRPILVGLTVLVLGFAWYQQLKPKKEIECDCEEAEKTSFWQSKKFLILVTIAAAFLLTFPYYAQELFSARSGNSAVQPEKLQTVTLQVEGMTCSGCEVNVNHAVGAVAGVVAVSSDHKTGEATVQFDSTRATRQQLQQAIQRAGYRVR